jgi:hypothetical protein
MVVAFIETQFNISYPFRADGQTPLPTEGRDSIDGIFFDVEGFSAAGVWLNPGA